MATHDATRANSALWAHYLEEQYGTWLTPFGGPAASMLLGAAIANAYGLFWSDFIGRLFATNAGPITAFTQASGAHVRPRWSATPLPPTALDEPPPWLREALDEIASREEAAAAPMRAGEPVGAR